MFKVIRDCPGFDLLRSVIGPENLRHSPNQSNEKLKLNQSRLGRLRFSHPLDYMVVFTCSPHELIKVFSLLLIGRCFKLTKLSRKLLHQNPEYKKVKLTKVPENN